ncbi:MAG: hypothetical protein LBV68_01445 [Spirochaetaceae bacterium]|jgi:hypothetical protein|nr:hypothetical protein [Spirochaetaceae bacterium]
MRKKTRIGLVAAVMLVITRMTSWGQEAGEISVGTLMEGNLSGRRGMSMAGGLIAGYALSECFTFGIKVDYGNDFDGLGIFEVTTYGRCYIALKKIEELRLWVQMGVGGTTFIESGRNGISSMAVDISTGVRFPVDSFYAEPYIRVGYPVPFGLGVIVGYKF